MSPVRSPIQCRGWRGKLETSGELRNPLTKICSLLQSYRLQDAMRLPERSGCGGKGHFLITRFDPAVPKLRDRIQAYIDRATAGCGVARPPLLPE